MTGSAAGKEPTTATASEETPLLEEKPLSEGTPHRIVTGTARAAASPWPRRFLALGLVLAALNLRPAVTSLGALMEEVRDGLGMNGTVAGLLTSIPSLCFAVLGPAAPRLARRWGPAAVVCAGLAAVATGLALRPFAGGVAGFLLLSALALAGIAVGNVLMPVVVKRWFPDRVGPMTGLYSMALTGGAAITAAGTVPLADAMGGGWRPGLAVWALLALAAALPWAVISRRPGERPERAAREAAVAGTVPDRPSGGIASEGAATGTTSERPVTGTAPKGAERAEATTPNAAPHGAHAPRSADADDARAPRITSSPTAWALAVFFGLQATGAYITMGWMPQIFRDAGVSASTAGLLAAVTMLMGVPFSFLLPRLAARLRNQGPLVVALVACGLAGYTGLWLAPVGGSWAWAVLLGIANSSFPLALTMIGMRARTGAGVVRLSAFAQSVGYLISIPGPLLVGRLYQQTGGWGLPIALLAALMVPQAVAGVLAGRNRSVEDEFRIR
ncbi:MFS transporter [Streptomyces mobaraensis NBRC 13819 = DSM 40847]|uniref:CynX/NimT family MFS transporter n=1 Tax=Streptomyces mobaraensis TaxID=35621 RepID=UPI000344B9B0|nr:MFS transporter [Streptomyces mobaraensis]QTT73187.1 MFS transporter [Streptomyces mobaraensis NBRC 13819 = DSM 40847]